jgi:hypothetical protein
MDMGVMCEIDRGRRTAMPSLRELGASRTGNLPQPLNPGRAAGISMVGDPADYQSVHNLRVGNALTFRLMSSASRHEARL